MHPIDQETWLRRTHFEFYRAFDQPHFGMCAPVDITIFHPFVKQRGYSMTVAIVYVLSRAANSISEFRYRIRGDEVVEHEVAHPSITVLAAEDVFSFCTFDYQVDFSEFAARAVARIAEVQAHPSLEDESGRDDFLFMTAIPWVSFTSFIHPMHRPASDSIPRLAWGKFFLEGERLMMPLAVQVHHALMDGLHVGKLYMQVQEDLDHPEVVLESG